MVSANFNLRNFLGGLFSRALSVVKRSSWRNFFVDSKTPILIDTENLLEVYQSCPHLQTVINKKADMLSNGMLKLRSKKDKKEIEKHWALDLMKNPNPLQSQKEFIYEHSIYYDIYANAFVYRNKPFPTSVPKVLWNLPSGSIKVVPTGKWLDQTELKGIVEKYELWSSGGKPLREFSTDDVIHINSGLSKSVIVSDSKILALQFPVSNIIGALRARNLFIYFGPKMIVSSKNSDTDGALPLGKEEKKRMETDFNQKDYGLGEYQSHTVITTSQITVDKMSYPTKDLMLFEEIEDDFAAICGAFGLDRDIFPSIKGATFENKKEGEKATYQTTIETASKGFCNFLDQLLIDGREDVEFYMDYSHLQVMQEDKQKAAVERKTNAETNAILFDKGIISDIQFAEMMDVNLDGRAVPKSTDSLGKIPLALQQLALARERANTAGDTVLSNAIGQAMDTLTAQMVASVITTTNEN